MKYYYLKWNWKNNKITIINGDADYYIKLTSVFFDFFKSKKIGNYLIGVENDEIVACAKVTQKNKFEMC